ncbi:hypothetical protein DAI22_12g074800 [Oryza sativa Japonica Group]|nr:hypothetical protein DAI22_12g074800 [Oryza sativa Japonica Group]
MHAFLFFMFICLACRQSGCASCFGDIWHSMLILSFFFPSPSLFSCYSLRFFLLPSFRSSIWCVVISPCHGRWLMLPVVLSCFLGELPLWVRCVAWLDFSFFLFTSCRSSMLGSIGLRPRRSAKLRCVQVESNDESTNSISSNEMSDPLVHLFIGLTVYSLPAILVHCLPNHTGQPISYNGKKEGEYLFSILLQPSQYSK